MYLRYTPDRALAGRTETSKPYGLGDWDALKLSLPTRAPPRAVQAAAPKPKPVSAAAAANALMNAEARTASIAFRRQDSDDSSDEDAPSPPNKVSTLAAKGPAAPLPDDDEIADNPDAAYVQLKLEATTLQRQLGLVVGKGGKKNAKVKGAPSATAKPDASSSDMLRLQAIEGKLKSSKPPNDDLILALKPVCSLADVPVQSQESRSGLSRRTRQAGQGRACGAVGTQG